MTHDGEILNSLLKELGFKKKILAQKLGISYNSVTNMLRQDVIKNERLIDVGKALRFDLTHKFPRLKKIPEGSELSYFNEDPGQLLNVVQEVKSEYKKHQKIEADLHLEINFLKERIDSLQTLVDAKNEIIESQKQLIESLRNEVSRLKDNEWCL